MSSSNGLASPLAQLVEAHRSAELIGEKLGISDGRIDVAVGGLTRQLPSELNAALRQAQAAVLALPDARLIAADVSDEELDAIRYFSDHRCSKYYETWEYGWGFAWGYWYLGGAGRGYWGLPEGDARAADKKIAELHIECVLHRGVDESSSEDEKEDAQAEVANAANYLVTLYALEGRLKDALGLIFDSNCLLFDLEPLLSATRIYLELGDLTAASEGLDVFIEWWASDEWLPSDPEIITAVAEFLCECYLSHQLEPSTGLVQCLEVVDRDWECAGEWSIHVVRAISRGIVDEEDLTGFCELGDPMDVMSRPQWEVFPAWEPAVGLPETSSKSAHLALWARRVIHNCLADCEEIDRVITDMFPPITSLLTKETSIAHLESLIPEIVASELGSNEGKEDSDPVPVVDPSGVSQAGSESDAAPQALTEAESASWAPNAPLEALTEAELQRRKARREAVRKAHQLKLEALRSDVRHQRTKALRSALDPFRQPRLKSRLFELASLHSSRWKLQHFELTQGSTVLLDVARDAYLNAKSQTELEAVIRDIDLILPVVDTVFHGAVASNSESQDKPDTELAKTFLRTLRAFASSRLGLPAPGLMQLLELEPAETRVDTRAPSISPDSGQIQRQLANIEQAIDWLGILTRKTRGPDPEASLTKIQTAVEELSIRDRVERSPVEFVEAAERMLVECIGQQTNDRLHDTERRMFALGLYFYSLETSFEEDFREVGMNWGVATEDLLNRVLFGPLKDNEQNWPLVISRESNEGRSGSQHLDGTSWTLGPMIGALNNLHLNPVLKGRLDELGLRQERDLRLLRKRIERLRSAARNPGVHRHPRGSVRRITRDLLRDCQEILFGVDGLIRLLTGALRPQS